MESSPNTIDGLTTMLLVECTRLSNLTKKEEKPIGEIATEMTSAIFDALVEPDITNWRSVATDELTLGWNVRLDTTSVRASGLNGRQREELYHVIEQKLRERLVDDHRYRVIGVSSNLSTWFTPSRAPK